MGTCELSLRDIVRGRHAREIFGSVIAILEMPGETDYRVTVLSPDGTDIVVRASELVIVRPEYLGRELRDGEWWDDPDEE
jgi:hypothetical protein